MPSRQCFRSPGVGPLFCARHLAKNPPPALCRPALSSAVGSLSPAPPPVAAPYPSPQAVTGPASDKDPVCPLPTLRPAHSPSLPHSSAPPPLARTRALSFWPLLRLPLAAPFLLSVHSFTVSLLGCRTFNAGHTSCFVAGI